ncbi:hypothetical protein OG244_28560 [Streptomyces brevispora]|uniref:hypothetical protein n=1 Tax=Streptomyces brevispora TaxID=887462 RepID=UPI002E32E886|nr:hypothetical protein [Streptomyces brevispora]
MADTDLIKMRLTFWRDGKKPGDLIDVPADEVHRWKGYAEKVEAPKPTAKSASPTAATAEQPKASK